MENRCPVPKRFPKVPKDNGTRLFNGCPVPKGSQRFLCVVNKGYSCINKGIFVIKCPYLSLFEDDLRTELSMIYTRTCHHGALFKSLICTQTACHSHVLIVQFIVSTNENTFLIQRYSCQHFQNILQS